MTVIPKGKTCSAWATPDDLGEPCKSLPIDPQLMLDCLQMATDYLWDVTRRQYGGLCTETIRPPGSRCPMGAVGLFVGKGRYVTSDGVPVGGIFNRGTSYADRESCSCGYISTVELPGVVNSVAEVMIDGVAIDPAEYRLDDHKRLVGLRKADGTLRIWPVCQRLDLPDGSIGTWQITYTQGRLPPVGGVRACAALACQLALAFQPPGSDLFKQCVLPQRVTMVTRQGVTAALLDPLKLFQEGQTGISIVDLWVSGELIGQDDRPATIFDPAQMRRVRRTGR